MARVRKLQEGNKIEATEKEVKPFLSYEGLGDIFADDISSNIARNSEDYLTIAGITDANERAKVMSRVADATKLISLGGVKADVSGKYTFDNQDYAHLKSEKEFNKKWGRTKKDNNYYNKIAFDIIDQAAKAGNAGGLTAEDIKKDAQRLGATSSTGQKSRKIFDGSWNTAAENDIFKGSEDLDWWFKKDPTQRQSELKSMIHNRIQQLNSEDFDTTHNFKVTGFKDKSAYAQALTKLAENLGTDWNEDTKTLLMNSGARGLEKYLNQNLANQSSIDSSGLYTGNETYDWAEGYNPSLEREATTFRFGDGIKSYYDKTTKKLRYIDPTTGGNLNAGADYYNDIFSPYQDFNGIWYDGKYISDINDNSLSSELRERLNHRRNYKKIGDSEDYLFNFDEAENDILEDLRQLNPNNDSDLSKRKYADFSGYFAGIQDRNVIGIYDSNNKTNAPSFYSIYNPTTKEHSIGNITYKKGIGYTFTDKSGKTELLSPDVNYNAAPSNFGGIERVYYEKDVVSPENFQIGLDQLVKKNDFSIANNMLSHKMLKTDTVEKGKNHKRVLSNDETTGKKIGISQGTGKNRLVLVIINNKGRNEFRWYNENTGKYTINPKQTSTQSKSTSKPLSKEEMLESAKKYGINLPTASSGTVELNKEGGVLKAQRGMYMPEQKNTIQANPLKVTKETTKEISDDEKDYQRFSRNSSGDISYGQFKNDVELSGADMVKLGALVGDLGSAVAGFVPGANLVSAGIGAGSSLAQFGADVSQDGFSLSNVGNLALNLGLDAASIIPGLKAGKVAKTISSIAKMGNKIAPLLASYGLVNAASVVYKLSTDDFKMEDLTRQDMMALTQGLRSLLSGRNLLAAGKGPKWMSGATKAKTIEINTPGGRQTIKVTDGEIDQLKSLRTYGSGATKERAKWAEDIIANRKIEGGTPVMGRTWKTGLLGRSPSINKTFDPDTPYTGNNIWYKHLQSIRNKQAVVGRYNRINGIDKSQNQQTSSTSPTSSSVPQNITIKGLNNLIGGKQMQFRNRPSQFNSLQFNNFEKGRPSFRMPYSLRKAGMWKEGGKIQFGKDGFSYAPSTANQWNRKKSVSQYMNSGFGQDLENWIASGNSATDYMREFNANQDGYETIKKDQYYTNRDGSIKSHQQNFRKINPWFDKQFLRNGVLGPANRSIDSENIENYDDYFGIRTDNRYLSDAAPEDAKTLNTILKNHGLEYYYDNTKTDGRQGRLRPLYGNIEPLAIQPKSSVKIPEKLINPLNPTNAGITPKDPISKNPLDTYKGRQSGKTPGTKLWDNVPILRGLDLGTALFTNNKVRNIRESANLLSPYEIHSNVVGDLGTKSAMYNQAADLERWAGRSKTSDGSLQMAGELDARMKGNQLRTQGHLADSQSIKESGQRALQAQFQNAAVRNQVANQNTQIVNGINSANRQIDRGYYLANSQAIQNMLGEMRQEAMVDRNLTRQVNLEKEKTLSNIDYMTNAEKLYQTNLAEWLKNEGATKDNFQQSRIYSERFLPAIQKAQQETTLNSYDAQNKIIRDKRYLPFKFFKSGGKLSKEDRIDIQRQKEVSKTLDSNAKIFNRAMMNTNNNTTRKLLSLDATTRNLLSEAFKYKK